MKCRRMSHRLHPVETHSRRHCASTGSSPVATDTNSRYNNLFEWIVSRVNVSMKLQQASQYVIGVLDI